MVACQPWLLAELSVLQPQGLVVFCATAGQALLGSSFRVGKTRGRLLDPPGLDCDWVIATVRRWPCLRSSERGAALDALVSDLSVAAKALTSSSVRAFLAR